MKRAAGIGQCGGPECLPQHRRELACGGVGGRCDAYIAEGPGDSSCDEGERVCYEGILYWTREWSEVAADSTVKS